MPNKTCYQILKQEEEFFFGKSKPTEKQREILFSVIAGGEALKNKFAEICQVHINNIKSVLWADKGFLLRFLPENKYPLTIIIKRYDETKATDYTQYLFNKRINNYIVLGFGRKLTAQTQRLLFHLCNALQETSIGVFLRLLEKINKKNANHKILQQNAPGCTSCFTDQTCNKGGQVNKQKCTGDKVPSLKKSNAVEYGVVKKPLEYQPSSLENEFKSLTEFVYFQWGNKHIGNIFMYQRMIQGRVSFSGVQLEEMSVIDHCDLECAFMDQHPDNWRHAYIYSIPENIKQLFVCENNQNNKKKYYHAVSLMYDDEIIHGGILRIQEYLEKIATEVENENVLVASGCTPIIIGDDVQSVVQKINNKNNNSFAYYDPRHKNNNAIVIYDQFLKDIMKDIPDRKVTAGVYNLVGAPLCLSMEEIVNNIEIFFKLKVNCRVLPIIGRERCQNYKAAAFQVLFPNADYKDFYQNTFMPLKQKSIFLDVPAGFINTRKWVEAICTEAGIMFKSMKEWSEYYARMESVWQGYVKKASAYTIGLILSPQDMDRIYDSQKNLLGIPLIAFIEEMGFTLDILLYCDSSTFLEKKERLEALMHNKEKHSIAYFSEHGGLEKWLAATKSSCLYSDIASDQRLLVRGKEQFSIFDLELGFEGAIRSIKSLLVKVETPFLKKYKKYFAKPLKIRA